MTPVRAAVITNVRDRSLTRVQSKCSDVVSLNLLGLVSLQVKMFGFELVSFVTRFIRHCYDLLICEVILISRLIWSRFNEIVTF